MTGATVDGLYYELHGGLAAGRDVVLLSSGLGGSGTFWAPQMAALTARWPVVLYDHRGTGRSAGPLLSPYAVSDMASDMVKVLDAVGAARAHVVGHAAGGNAGLALALAHPDRLSRLVVVNGWSRPDAHLRRCFDTRIRLLEDSGPAAYVHAQPLFLYPATWTSQNHARLEAEEPHHLAAFPPRETMLARIRALLAFDVDDRLGEIDHPVLVAASADDMLVPITCAERLAVRLPNAVLDVAPWGGHAMTVTDPDRFNTRLVAFLEGQG